jgi:hypothetical protein
MKRLLLFLLFLIVFSVGIPLYSAEVSERQDIAIFGLTYYSHKIPDDVLGYVDSSINHIFVNLKRFNVLGYGDYRMESKDIDDFISRIRELQADKAKEEAGTYDEKFGTVVIKGEDFDRIVGSFLVVIPSLATYTVAKEETEVVRGDITYVEKAFVVDIVIDLTFVNVKEGTQEESVRITGQGRDLDRDRAEKSAVDFAVSMLDYDIKQVDAFKIKSGIIRRTGDLVLFELGQNIGIKAGDEYEVMTKQEIGKTGRIVELPSGLVRVKKVYPDVTEAKVVYQKERITEGDQLLELPMMGLQLSFNAGAMQVDVPDMDYNIQLVDDNWIFGNTYEVSLDQPARHFALTAGARLSKNLGYRFKGIFDATALLNFPLFGIIGEAGASASLNLRRFSFEALAQGGLLYMTTFQQDLYRNNLAPDFKIDGTDFDFDNDPVLTINGFTVGLKGETGIRYLIKPNSSLRIGLGYRLYAPINNWYLTIKETAGSRKNSITIGGDHENVIEDANSGGMKQVRISGFEATLSFILRF